MSNSVIGGYGHRMSVDGQIYLGCVSEVMFVHIHELSTSLLSQFNVHTGQSGGIISIIECLNISIV